ncbi:MAG: molecular chaperone HtpG [Spirochaetes bacterium]|nr:molecular chaperone HtpG [Spirochaetota bacterium]
MAKHQFKTEVSKLLELITHSLYSHKEIFLRELVSNASDAIDKLRYLTISDDAYKTITFDPKITVFVDAKAKTITLSDNGVGMDEDELADNLGTIARSGTRTFMEKLSDSERKDSNLIGQFGVGFYSIFMIAEKAEVLSRTAGEDAAFRWESNGKGSFTVEPALREGFGTDIVLHVNAEGGEYLSRWSLEALLKKYSNHIAYPIHLVSQEPKYDDKGKENGTEFKDEQTNTAQALWRRSKSELVDKDYLDFYKSFSGEDEEPLLWIHTKGEGTIEYNSLFYIPSKVPGDLYYPVSQQGVKLYIRRVFITDRETNFLPQYFRFVRGVVDSDDLPLNISREILQQNRVMTTIQQASLKKIFSELESLAKNNSEKYLKFVELFNPQLKEGIISDWQNQKTLLGLVRYKSTSVEGWTRLEDYKTRAGDRKVIYYITGNSEERLRASPLLEVFAAKGVEVLIGPDEIDELAFNSIGQYEGLSFKSVNHVDSDEVLGKTEGGDEVAGKKAVEAAKRILGERVKDVRLSKRLAKSPSCVVMDSDDPTLQYRELMKRLSGVETPEPTPILELNPSHPLIARLATMEEKHAAMPEDAVAAADEEDLACILLDQALLAEGQKFIKPAEFIERLNRQLAK